jgi:hypothetical protein
MTNVGSPFALEATTIECFGTFNGKAFVRTKSGLSHLIEGDVFKHMQRWDDALRGVQTLEVVEVKVIDVKPLLPEARPPTSDHRPPTKARPDPNRKFR